MPRDLKRKGLRPTVFEPPAKRAPKPPKPVDDPASIPPTTTRTVQTPTAIPGVERKRISVNAGDLQELSPGSTTIVYQKAIALLNTVIVGLITDRSAILWGHESQRSYSDLVTQTLTLSQHPVLPKVQGYLNRMMKILGAIDILAVCDNTGVFGQFTKSVNAKIDTPFELSEAQKELGLLVQYMSAALNELLDLKLKLEQNSSKLDQIAEDIEASALAALFLSNYLNTSPFAQRFLERSMSLTQTLAQIRQNDSIRKIQIEQPLKLVNAIQNVALVMMPGLISSLASIITLMQARVVSPTEAGELNYQLRNVVDKLNT